MNIKNKKSVFIILSSLSFLGLFIVLFIISQSKHSQILQSRQLVIQEASAHYKNIKELEIWHNKFGGIFQNNYTQIHDNEYFFNIYSLKPKNQENLAIGFSKEGLEFFKNNSSDNVYYKFDNGDLQFIGALRTTQNCIECHNDFKIGDLRGGIEITIPTVNYKNAISTINSQYSTFYMMVFGFFVITLSSLLYLIKKMYDKKEEIENLNNSLELKVIERTNEINKLYDKEHYLKSLLETISELNQSLIETYSISSIIKTSLKKLQHHSSYKMIIFAHFDGETYHIKYNYGDLYGYFNEEYYSISTIKSMEISISIANAIENKHWSIDDKINLFSHNLHHRRNDYDLKASITLPLLDRENRHGFDLITIFTDRDGGFDNEEISILDTVVQDIKMALSAYKQRKLTEHLQKEQITNYEETILAFVDMIEQRDAYTAGHTLRVAKYSRLIAQELHIDEHTIKKIEKSAILHDIGKIATPDTILLKPGRLSKLEYKLIQNHVSAGYKMLSKVKMYSELAEIMKYHHEHYDGTGYPYGLKGDEIPIEAHILVVADAFDAMTTNRIYKGRMNVEDAIEELNKNSGTQFHPDVVKVASKCLKNISIHQTTQMPQSELEQQRFSYFFNDNLTGLYNEAYLQLVLNEGKQNFFAYIIKTKHFVDFNKEYGWDKSNELLKLVSNELQSYFKDCKIFRFEGDDFLILSDKHIIFSMDNINLSLMDYKNIISFDYQEYHIESKTDFDDFKLKFQVER
ncbi:MAG: HD domain-containing protein [Arcobacteraceae bacterium]|nr:HD domain-containing protein [Arcobacteraceae bacterium]MDY0326913.1 HD domain-containing protein [Arcobacteraceae bacterium]